MGHFLGESIKKEICDIEDKVINDAMHMAEISDGRRLVWDRKDFWTA